MRNTYNISLLRKRIHDALPRPLSAVGESALEGFLALAGVSLWRPDRLGIRELSRVFDIGLPFALIGDNPSVRSHAMYVGDCVRDGYLPDEARWRVIHAGALLSHWGAAVQFAADITVAPQLEVRLQTGETLDVEVIPADRALITNTVSIRGNGEQPERSRLVAIDVRGTHSAHEEISATFVGDFAQSERLTGVLTFEPRFWIGVEQKEWLHLARLNPGASVQIPADVLGMADTGRRALRLPLLS